MLLPRHVKQGTDLATNGESAEDVGIINKLLDVVMTLEYKSLTYAV